uniref:Neurotransmitter-gated ion-channel ligand-binding domain-containing protein n=1 Tax=Pyramimonas obovata TaxID=1411642 RepID=A0A7S0RLW7_9CHLO|mmetsp:Transcript_37783/g.82188  ORF Transcript_37783/g.82188 Transcript_37783/m.82188 type:complete len:462 (+) Transcript_37783:145-1530(+)|eukprot:CAMPEP_0118945524 /NCGR_PEP_ID=MMETSP1169-20130426/42433_1 /TAXON_ID=36882 /ORGANISM="Pyramimonas obovata, Strain CCMP722" /LENGTH=461 /DNA_ID=CAMNT_0006891261 /DNA_START=91 /DNA_END=1476 /DNA_ORIENTATION=+
MGEPTWRPLVLSVWFVLSSCGASPRQLLTDENTYQINYEVFGLGDTQEHGGQGKCTAPNPRLDWDRFATWTTGSLNDATALPTPLSAQYFQSNTDLGYITTNSQDEVINITAQIMIASIWGVDQKTTLFKAKGRVTTWHHDCRLTHGAPEGSVNFDTDEKLSQIWMPSWHLHNQRAFDRLEITTRDCTIYSSGVVECHTRFLGTFFSPFDLRDAPFDEQYLKFEIKSFEDDTILRLAWDNEARPMYVEEKIASSGWKVQQTGFPALSTSVGNPNNNRTVSKLTSSIKIEREGFKSMMSTMLPAVLYWILSYIGFFIPPAAVPARAVLGTIPVLMLLNLNSRLNASFGDLDYLPWILKFSLGTTILTICNFLVYAVLVWTNGMLEKMHAKYKLKAKGSFSEEAARDTFLADRPQPENPPSTPKHLAMCIKILSSMKKMEAYLGLIFFGIYSIFLIAMLAPEA